MDHATMIDADNGTGNRHTAPAAISRSNAAIHKNSR